MKKSWRAYLLVGIITLISCIYSIPNIFGEAPAIELTPVVGNKISSITFNKITNLLKQNKLYPNNIKIEPGKYVLLYKDPGKQIKAKSIINQNFNSRVNSNLNIVSRSPTWLEQIGANPMKLGLDLRGGIHLLLSVDINTMLLTQANKNAKEIKTFLNQSNLKFDSIKVDPNNSAITIKTNQENTITQALKNKFPSLEIQKQQQQIEIPINLTERKNISDYVMNKTIATLNKRVNELGVAEAVIQRQGFDQIAVDLPGIQDAARAHSIIGKTATLRFYLEDMNHSPIDAEKNGAPKGTRLYYFKGRPILLEDKPILTGDSIAYATSTMAEGSPLVIIRLGHGGSAFNAATAKNIGRPMASVYVERKQHINMVRGQPILSSYNYERIINIATIQSALGDNFQISGIHSEKEASDLALLLRSGALAAPINIVQETTIGPSLGQENINQGILSLEIGSALVIGFMLIYYRLFGLIANLAISLNIVMIIAALSLIGTTLTLPGIAGIVLTVGMAVDANVLINERIREELRKGSNSLTSIKAGYEQAFATIVDSNVTTLIVAIILFGLGSGSIRGFAITLIIGLLSSLFTSVTFTRLIVDTIYHKDNDTKKLSIGI